MNSNIFTKICSFLQTGCSRGFAFIEFACEEVAAIVAETMNNYLMFDKLLKVRVVEPDKVTPAMFHCRGPKHEIPLASRLKTAQRYFNQVYICIEPCCL